MGNDDTVGDLISDTLGAAAGGLLLVAWTKYGWGSVRRVPGDNRAEDNGRLELALEHGGPGVRLLAHQVGDQVDRACDEHRSGRPGELPGRG